MSMESFFFFNFFWLCCAAWGILVPQPGIEPMSLAVKAWSLNHWMSRDVPTYYYFLFQLIFYWSIVELQCCVNYSCRAKWFSYTFIYILFHFLFHYVLSQDIEYSLLCYTVGPCCFSSLYIPVQPSPTPLPLGILSLCPWFCFYFIDRFICVMF